MTSQKLINNNLNILTQTLRKPPLWYDNPYITEYFTQTENNDKFYKALEYRPARTIPGLVFETLLIFTFRENEPVRIYGRNRRTTGLRLREWIKENLDEYIGDLIFSATNPEGMGYLIFEYIDIDQLDLN